MKKKKLFFIITGCLLVAALSFGVTYSYLTASTTAVNEFNVVENDITIEEKFAPPPALTHGCTIPKVVQIRNTGNVTCYVRVRVVFSDSAAENFCEPIVYNPVYEGNDPDAKWVARDGYYYYTKPIAVQELTNPLFKEVKIRDDVDDGDLVNFDIMVYAESCGAGTAESYSEAWGLEVEQP